jgi:predicted ribosomally synthesized peptide with SipW-like signal peptide
MTDETFELTRRKALAGLGTIGVASGGAGLGTSAFFSDTESFDGNSLTAGTLDMKAAYSAHYSDWSDDEGQGVSVRMWDGAPNTTGSSGDLESGETGLPANDAWLIAVDDPEQFLANTQYDAQGDVAADCPAGTDADDLDAPIIDVTGDVKPGDFGEVTFDFRLCDNPGFVWLTGRPVTAAENGVNEPEGKDDDETGPDDESYDVENGDTVADILNSEIELLDVIKAAAWIDDGGDGPGGNADGNNYQNGSETPFLAGSLRTVLTELNSGAGFPLAGDQSAEAGGGMGRNCFSGDTKHSVAFAWWVPVDHGNEIQSDSVTFDLGFYTEQCRHNDGLRDEGDITLYGSSVQGQGGGFAYPWETTTSVAHTGSGSWGTIDRSGSFSDYKQGFYFGGEFDTNNVLPEYTIEEIDEISYWLYEPNSSLQGNDVFLNIYTKPESDGDDTKSWFDSRLAALPAEAEGGSPTFSANTWTKFTTKVSGPNTLNFWDSGRAPQFNNGVNYINKPAASDQPTLSDLQSGDINWSNYGTNEADSPYSYYDETVKALSLQTNSTSPELEAYIDDVTVTLTSGETLNLDLEP